MPRSTKPSRPAPRVIRTPLPPQVRQKVLRPTPRKPPTNIRGGGFRG